MKDNNDRSYLLLRISSFMLKILSLFGLYFGLMGAFTYSGRSAGVRLLIFLIGLSMALILLTCGELIKVVVRDILLPRQKNK